VNVINWLRLQPTEAEFTNALKALQEVVHLRTLLQALVRAVLQTYPWHHRDDLIPLFDPTHCYAVGDFVALPLHDEQELRPDTWRVAQVKVVAEGHNPVQGTFQVVTIEVDGREGRYAAGLAEDRPLSLAFPLQDPEDLEWLVGAGITEATEWIEGTEGTSVPSVTFSAFSDSPRCTGGR